MTNQDKINYMKLGANVIIPHENINYPKISTKLIHKIKQILFKRYTEVTGKHLIMSIKEKTNIFPLNNMNKYLPLEIEALADSAFERINTSDNPYGLLHVDIGLKRTDLADIILHFKINGKKHPIQVHIDVKATDENIRNAGKGPNITSFLKIRSAYLKNPNFIYIILSMCYKPYIKSDKDGNALIDVKVTSFHIYDFKYMSSHDFDINPSLGQGQIQVKDIHNVHRHQRTTWQLLNLLDNKYIRSSKRTPQQWLKIATRYHWLK